jgi:Uma2 family endonuclease
LYAAAGIPEMWIVDLESRIVEVATQPGSTDYSQVRQVAPGGQLTPVTLPELNVAVAEILG